MKELRLRIAKLLAPIRIKVVEIKVEIKKPAIIEIK